MDDLISRQVIIDAIDEIESEVEDGDGFQYEKWRQYFCELPSAEPRWIPVTERLPEDEVNVFVTDDAGGLATTEIDCMFTREDTGEREWLTSQRVTAWMPRPKPYKGGEY